MIRLDRHLPSTTTFRHSKTSPFIVTATLVVVLLGVVSTVDARTWRTRDGKTHEGLLSGVVNGVAEIDSNGRILRIPVSDLSDADQAYIRSQSGESGGSNAPTQPASGGNTSAPTTSNTGGSASTISLEPRTWTDTQNNKIEGRFGGVKDNIVTIVGSGKPVNVSLDRLSVEDQIYVRRVQNALDPTRHGRSWILTDQSQMQGSFVQAHGDEIWILTSITDDRAEIPTIRLSQRDQEFVCVTLDKRSAPGSISRAVYRTWHNTKENWKMVGRLKDFSRNLAVVEQEHQNYYLKLDELSLVDQAYVREFFPTDKGDNEEEEKELKEAEQSWNVGGFNLAAIGMSVFAVSALTLIAAICLKYVRESFEANE